MGIFGSSSTVATSSPRISSFLVNQSTYGAPLKLIFGTTMVSGVLIDFQDFSAIAHTTTTESGGKGGGGVTSSNTTYTYTVAAAMALGEGRITGVGRIWEGSKTTDAGSLGLTFFDGSSGGSIHYEYHNASVQASGNSSDTININLAQYADAIYSVSEHCTYYFFGENTSDTIVSPDRYTLANSVIAIRPAQGSIGGTVTYTVSYRYKTIAGSGQRPWGYMITNHGDHALTYSGTSYLAGVINLGDSASLPNFNFEVYGLCQSQQGAPSTDKVQQYSFQKTIEISNFSANQYVQEYQYGQGWITLDSKYYTIDQKKDDSDNTISGVYVYTFNFDDRDDGADRDDPLYIRIHYTAASASVSYTATDANPRDIIYELMTNTVWGECFPVALMDDLSVYSAYCKKYSFLISPSIDSQTSCSDIISNIMECTNSEFVFSQGKAKIIPYYDGLEPAYDITDNNIIDQGDNSISITRTAQADTYNIVPLEYLDRNADYNTNVVYATDEGDIELHGVRQMGTKSHHEIMNSSLAQMVAQLILQKQLYNRGQYVLKLPQEFIRLEPMDPITLQSDLFGLGVTAVRVVEIKESKEDFMLEITFEDNLSGVLSAEHYETQDTTRANVNLGVSPGNINYPVMFEAPNDLVSSGLGYEVWMYASGGINWGGCGVWISEDDEHYKRIGYIDSPARQGVLKSAIAVGTDPDTTNVLAVDLRMPDGVLTSGTRNDADNLNTLCWVDGEFMAYQTATLAAVNNYNLSYLRRGVYRSTAAAHAAGSQFVRCDDAVFKHPFSKDDIGKNVYVKFTSRNIYGESEQALSDVSAYTLKIKGTSLTSPPNTVSNLTAYYENGNMYLSWTAVTDFRSPIEYEIRKGTSNENAEVLGRTYSTKYQVQGNGRYLIYTVYKDVYSSTPAEIIVTGARYTNNVIATVDEYSTGWTGTKTREMAVDSSGFLALFGSGYFDSITSVDDVNNVDYYGGAASSGTYTIPEDHRIDIGKSALCNVSINYTAYGDTINATFDAITDVDSVTNIDGNYSGYTSFKAQIRIAGDDGTFGDWQDFYVGQYNGRIFDFRINAYSTDENISAIISDFSYAVDVPDLSESKNISIPAAGTTISYENNYHVVPLPQLTIYGALSGDDVVLSNMTQTSFTVQIVNNGEGVIRRANYFVQSY